MHVLGRGGPQHSLKEFHTKANFVVNDCRWFEVHKDVGNKWALTNLLRMGFDKSVTKDFHTQTKPQMSAKADTKALQDTNAKEKRPICYQ